MNTHTLRLSGLVYLLIAVAIAVGAVAAAASLGMLGGSPQVTAGANHGDCTGAVTDIDPDTDDLATYDTGSDKIVTGVCIKAGTMFNGDHGFFTENAAGIEDCYTITGIGTSSIEVTRTGDPGPDCQQISHIDVIEGDAPTPTPTATATAPAEATPAATPTPTAAVLGETQEPAALPVSGGAPEEAIVSSLYLLLGLAGLALLIGGGTLVAVAVRRRR